MGTKQQQSNTRRIDAKRVSTALEAALLLGVRNYTVGQYLRNGKLIGEKRGPKKQWYVSGSEIIRLLKEWRNLG